jgi:hypothetical protein
MSIIQVEDDDDHGATFRVTLDDVTVARLMEIADACHAPPTAVIAALVRDVLEDDALAHGEGTDDLMLLQ